MRYREAVAEARQLIKRSEADQWRLAELTYDQLTVQGIDQKTWAADIGMSQSHVSTLSRIWAKYGTADDRPRYSDAYIAIMQGTSVEDARPTQRLKEAAAILRKATVDQRAAVVEEVLGSAEGADVMEKVLDRSVAASANIGTASDRQHQKRQRQTYDRDTDRRPGLVRAGHIAEAVRLIRHGKADLADAIVALQAAIALAPLRADEQTELAGVLGLLQFQKDACGDVVAGGNRTMEDELLR